MQYQGLIITRVEGEGTNKVTIYFIPPYTEHSPLAIVFSATPLGVIAIALIVIGVLGTLGLLKWLFGSATPEVVGIGAVIAIAAIIVLLSRRRD